MVDIDNIVLILHESNYIAETVSYTDYYPHGGTLPGRNYSSSLSFPYGYQGQEKDAATGLTMAADAIVLDPSDAVVPKWVVYGVAATAAGVYLYSNDVFNKMQREIDRLVQKPLGLWAFNML